MKIEDYNGFIVSLVDRPLYKALCTRLSNAQLSTPSERRSARESLEGYQHKQIFQIIQCKIHEDVLDESA